MDKLRRDIELHRDQLNKLTRILAMQDPRVIKVSNELDNLINQFIKAKASQ